MCLKALVISEVCGFDVYPFTQPVSRSAGFDTTHVNQIANRENFFK